MGGGSAVVQDYAMPAASSSSSSSTSEDRPAGVPPSTDDLLMASDARHRHSQDGSMSPSRVPHYWSFEDYSTRLDNARASSISARSHQQQRHTSLPDDQHQQGIDEDQFDFVTASAARDRGQPAPITERQRGSAVPNDDDDEDDAAFKPPALSPTLMRSAATSAIPSPSTHDHRLSPASSSSPTAPSTLAIPGATAFAPASTKSNNRQSMNANSSRCKEA